MATRTHLAKAYSPKGLKKKSKKPGQTSSQADLREAAGGTEEEKDVTGEPGTKSKDRLLLLFDEKVQGDSVNADLFKQLQAKDGLIDQLNARIVSISSQTKRLEFDSLSAKEKQMKAALEDKVLLTKMLKTSEEKAADLESRLAVSEKTLEDEKEQLELLNEALTEEGEALKSQTNDKAEQLRAARNDVLEMSKIVADLTKLNAELNDKIISLNAEMEKNNTEHYQAIKKAEQIDELEKELLQTKTDLQQLESKQKLTAEEAAQGKEKGELLYRVGKELDGVIAKLSSVENETCRTAATSLDLLVVAIRTHANAPRPDDPEKLVSIKAKVKELTATVEEERRKAGRAAASEKAHLSRVESLTAEYEKMKATYEEAIDRLKQRQTAMQNTQESVLTQRHELESKLEAARMDLQKKQTEAASTAEKLQSTKARLEDMRKSDQEHKKSIRELKLELIQTQSGNAILEESASAKDQKAKDALSKLAAVNDELWRRDNDILRRETQRLKLVEELNSLKSSVQHSHMILKYRNASDMEQVNVRLEEKEKEISALKKMLQSRSVNQSAGAKRDTLSDKEIAEKLEDALKRMKAMKDSSGEHEDTVPSAKAISLMRSLQADLKNYRDAGLSEDAIQDTTLLKSLRRQFGDSVTVGELIDQAVSLTA